MTDAAFKTGTGAQAPVPGSRRSVRVWDPLVRLVHWGVATGVLLNAAFTDPEKQTHDLIGYAVVAFVAVRLVWGFFGTRHARFTAFPPNPMAALRHLKGLRRGANGIHLSHNPAGALMSYNLWATLIGMGVTDYMMGTPQYFGIEWVEKVQADRDHQPVEQALVHLFGVVFDSLLTRVNLVRAMVDGRKRVPVDARQK